MGEPKYVKELKTQVHDMDVSIGLIQQTLDDHLPEMKKDLEALNGRVRKHETSIAVVKERQNECIARKAFASGSPFVASDGVMDLGTTKGKAQMAGVVVGVPVFVWLLLQVAELVMPYLFGAV